MGGGNNRQSNKISRSLGRFFSIILLAQMMKIPAQVHFVAKTSILVNGKAGSLFRCTTLGCAHIKSLFLSACFCLRKCAFVRLHSHCTIFYKRVKARAEIRHTNPLQCSHCKNILQSEHCKELVWRISARAFKRFQTIVQCERSLRVFRLD